MMFFSQFTQMQQYYDAWRKMVSGHIERLDALEAQFRAGEERGYAQMTEAIDETAKLMKASLDYNKQLASEWRKQTLDATKQAINLGSMTPGG